MFGVSGKKDQVEEDSGACLRRLPHSYQAFMHASGCKRPDQ